MNPRMVDIAAHLEVSRQQANNLKNAGMPCDSLEAASAWYNAKRVEQGLGVREKGDKPAEPARTDESFAEIVAQHRALKQRAYEKYLDDLNHGSVSEQSKSYATYDKLLKTMVNLEREAQARDIASRRLIESSLAVAVFGKVLEAVRNELIQQGTRVGPKANPDDPRLAMKAIDADAARMLARLSGAAEDAVESLTTTAEKVVVTDAPEPTETTEEKDV